MNERKIKRLETALKNATIQLLELQKQNELEKLESFFKNNWSKIDNPFFHDAHVIHNNISYHLELSSIQADIEIMKREYSSQFSKVDSIYEKYLGEE